MITRSIFVVLTLIAFPAAAHASGGTQIPEASSALLFALGAVGVLVGRHASMSRKTRKESKHRAD